MRVKSRKSLILIRQMIDNFINTLHAPIQLIPRNRSRNNLRFKRAPRVFFFTLAFFSSRSSQLAITFPVDAADF